MTEIELIRAKPETDDVTTFQFTRHNLEWRAGQYMAFVIPEVSPILQQYEHWFTISSAPCQDTINISVRHSNSPFKRALLNMKPGDHILTHTVDGDFSWPSNQSIHPTFIAGGIGVTPFISMLRQQEHDHRVINAILHYFSRPESQIAFRSEIDEMANRHSGFEVYYHAEKPFSLTPIVSAKNIAPNTLAFLAGPPPMIDRLSAELRQNDIETRLDWYFGYDVTNF